MANELVANTSSGRYRAEGHLATCGEHLFARLALAARCWPLLSFGCSSPLQPAATTIIIIIIMMVTVMATTTCSRRSATTTARTHAFHHNTLAEDDEKAVHFLSRVHANAAGRLKLATLTREPLKFNLNGSQVVVNWIAKTRFNSGSSCCVARPARLGCAVRVSVRPPVRPSVRLCVRLWLPLISQARLRRTVHASARGGSCEASERNKTSHRTRIISFRVAALADA